MELNVDLERKMSPKNEEIEIGEIKENEPSKKRKSSRKKREITEERMIYDEESGFYFDTLTNLHFDEHSDLFYDFSVEPYCCYHWNNGEQTYNLTDEGKFRIDTEEYLQELNIIKQKNKRARKQKSNQQKEKEDSMAETPEARFMFDQTSNTYFDKKTKLYYDPQSDLWKDYRTYPALCFHWNPLLQVYMSVSTSDIYQPVKHEEDEEEEVEEAPFKICLVAYDVENENEQGVYEIMDPFAESQGNTITIGRAKTNKIVLLDIGASKHHAKIVWESVFWENFFWLVDLGSLHGTFLNGVRISESRCVSDEKAHQLKEGDSFVIGNTKFLLTRVYQQKKEKEIPVETEDLLFSIQEIQQKKKKEYQKFKRQFLKLTPQEIEERKLAKQKYQDRAAQRRENTDAEPLPLNLNVRPSKSPAEPIGQKNPGFRLLQSMGWKEGEGLGRDRTGRVEPLQPKKIDGKSGLGFQS